MIINQEKKCLCSVNLTEKYSILKMYLDQHQHVCTAD